MSAPLSVALIGAGAIATTWVQAFQACAGARLSVVCDLRGDSAAAQAEPVGADAVTSLDDVLGRDDVTAAVICTPPSTHREIALALIAGGRHVLCEKPLAPTMADAVAMLEAAGSAGTLLSMASKFRYVEDVVRARSLITSGALGRPVLFENAFISRADMAGRWNADPAVSGGGVLIDNGTHSVDIARYLLGPLTEVLATVDDAAGLGVEDSARLLLRTESATIGTATVSWSASSFDNTYVEVVGTEGVVRVGWSRSRFRRSSSPTWEDIGSGYDKVGAHVRQIETFAAAVAGEGELLVDENDALASVAAIDAAYRSVASRSWEPVRPVRRGR